MTVEPLLCCPQCHATPLRSADRYCRRCGLADVVRWASDRSAADVNGAGRTFHVLERIAVGSLSSVYRCRFERSGAPAEGVFKLARDARVNHLLSNEAAVLVSLRRADSTSRFTPFLPTVESAFIVDDDYAHQFACTPPVGRQATVLGVHPAIRSPSDELYTLDQVRGQHPAGLDPRHVAWIWRRVLTVLGFTHQQGIVHGAPLPPHILIEPKEHKLVLVGWCGATRAWGGVSVRSLSGAHADWYQREQAARLIASPALDIALAARGMIHLLGGSGVTGMVPPRLEPALQRYFAGCINAPGHGRPEAWRLLAEFDRLTESLWGARQHVPLVLKPKLDAEAFPGKPVPSAGNH